MQAEWSCTNLENPNQSLGDGLGLKRRIKVNKKKGILVEKLGTEKRFMSFKRPRNVNGEV